MCLCICVWGYVHVSVYLKLTGIFLILTLYLNF